MDAPRVAVTGGIGSGKSTVSRLLARRGAVVVDADVVAREVVAPGTPGLAAVVDAFGPDVLAADGTLDRPAVAARVFADAAARRRLEGIVHPLVQAETARRLATVAPDRVTVYDVPLLAEAGGHGRAPFDVVVVVTAAADVRVERLTRRGLAADDARRRIAAQADDDTRAALADVVIDNSGDEHALAARVDVLWDELTAGRRPGRDAGHGADPGSTAASPIG